MHSKSLEPCLILCNSWTAAYQGPLFRGFSRQDCFCCESCWVVSHSLRPHGLYSLWYSPGQNAGVGSHSLLQWIFPTQDRTQVSRIVSRRFTVWATKIQASSQKTPKLPPQNTCNQVISYKSDLQIFTYIFWIAVPSHISKLMSNVFITHQNTLKIYHFCHIVKTDI